MMSSNSTRSLASSSSCFNCFLIADFFQFTAYKIIYANDNVLFSIELILFSINFSLGDRASSYSIRLEVTYRCIKEFDYNLP